MTPSIGRTVHYTLAISDAASINSRIDTGMLAANRAMEGDTYPAVIVRVWGDASHDGASCNLQVLLDGDGAHWATSRIQGSEPGQWHEPPRV